VALVDEPLIPKRLDDPPDRFHVIGVHRLVVMVEIDPASEARDDLAPLFDVAEDRGAAGLVEFGDAIALDVGFRIEAKFLFNESFDR